MINDFEGKDESGIRYSFSIGYDGNIPNKETYREFKELSKYFDDCYIATLKHLLEVRRQGGLLNSVFDVVDELNARVSAIELELIELRGQVQQKKKKSMTFGED